jgi:hypothetical protein
MPGVCPNRADLQIFGVHETKSKIQRTDYAVMSEFPASKHRVDEISWPVSKGVQEVIIVIQPIEN